MLDTVIRRLKYPGALSLSNNPENGILTALEQTLNCASRAHKNQAFLGVNKSLLPAA